MNIRAFGKLLFSGFGLPLGEFRESQFLPSRLQKRPNRPGFWPRTPNRDRIKALIPIAGLAGLVLALVMNAGVTPLPANANNCQVGSSSACPATSPQEIANLYGTTTNGLYWLNVGGTARQVFVVMDTATSWGSGHWILLMKGARGTSNFGYTSNLFTSNTTVLNEGSPARDFTSDAKYHAYNSISLSQMLAVIASPERGIISNQGDIPNNSFGGHTWLENTSNETAFTRLTTFRSLNSPNDLAASSVPVLKYRQNSSGGTQVFSLQTGTGRYGHANECGATSYKTRWGIIWNNESTQLGSCDAFVGIGAQYNGADMSPRDQVTYNDSLTFPAPSANNNGGLGQFAFQIWGKMAAPSQTAPAAPSVVNAGLDRVTVSWTAPSGPPTDYVVQYRLSSSSTWPTDQSVVVAGTSTTITGLSNSTSYDFRVMARTSANSSLPSALTSHSITPITISFNANSGTGSISSVTVASGVNTTLPANSLTRDRFTFRGWNTSANGTGTSYTNQDTISTTSDLTLFAMWTSLDDRAWDKGNVDGDYAFLNDSVNPVIPISAAAAWTIETWVRPDTIATGWSALFAQQDNADVANTTRNTIWLNTGEIVLVTPGASSDVFTGIILQANRWTHIAWVMSTSTSSELYLDGQLVWSGTLTRGTGGGTHFAIGGSRQVGHPEFDGHIDQVKVWGTNLSSTQVSRSMHAHGTSFVGAPASSCVSGLRALYDFNEFNSGIVLDRSNCGRHLAFNTGVSGNYTEPNFKTDAILETGSTTLITHFKFNRSYLTAVGGWTPPVGVSNMRALVVGGGGSGGNTYDNTLARGGSGGATTEQALAVLGTIPITVGQGGQRVFIPSGNTSTTLHASGGRAGQGSAAGNLESLGGAAGGGRGSNTLPMFNTLVSGFRGAIFGLGGASGSNLLNSSGAEGAVNSGNGGGGASALSGSLTGGFRNMGGNGGSGAVILFYGSELTVVDGTVPTITRPGELFNSTIQINVPITGTQLTDQVIRVRAVNLANGATLSLTRSGSTATFHEVTSVNGVATFTGLGLSSSTPFGSYILEFSNGNFWGETLSITQSIADSISIVNGAAIAGGSFNGQGVFIASASSVSIGKSALATVLSTSSALIEARSSLAVTGADSMTSTSGNNLTLRTLGGSDLNLGTDTARIGSIEVGGKLILNATNHLHINLAANQILRGDSGIELLSTNFIKGGNSSLITFTTGRLESALGNIVATASATRLGESVTASQGGISFSQISGSFETTTLVSAGQDISIRADSIELSQSGGLSASNGIVTLLPQTNNRVFNLGTETAGQLSLTSDEINRVTASTLRIGALNGSNTGNINITSALNPSGVQTLALRTGGSVSSSVNRPITETNLGVQAVGTISLAADNSISGNLALNSPGASLTFNQTSGSFTPGTVDGISPEYGVPSSLTLSRVPTTATENRTLGQDFDPSPVATLRDEFGNLLSLTNSQASNYSITVTRATGSGTVSGTLVRSTTAGVATFDNLRIISATGAHTLTFSASSASAPAQIVGSPSATTGTYNVRGTQTITFSEMINRTLGALNNFTVTATTDRGLTVAFSSDTSSVCTVSGTTVSMVTAGTCRINANQAGDASNAPATQVQREFVISSALVLTTPSSGLTGTFNTPYTLTLSRTGGASPYTFAVASGALPSGLSIESSTGVIRGTPSAASTQTVTVRVTDANGAISTTDAFTLSVSRETLATPTAPTVVASTMSLKRLDVSWSAVSNASSYVLKLYDSTGSGSALATVSVTSGTTRTLTTSDYASFADLTVYTVSVQAIGVSNYQDSLESLKTSARTRGLPQSITVDTAGVVDATGAWIGGTWYTATLGTSRITPTVLQNQMSAASATLLTAGSITVSNAVASPNGTSSLNLTSTGSNVTLNAAVSGLFGLTVTCNSGTFSSNSSGTISAGGDVTIQCSVITTGGTLSSSGSTYLTTSGASSDLTAGANMTISGVGQELVLKSKRSVLTSANVNLRTAGGPLTIWSDSDATNGGGIRLGDSNALCSGWSSNTCNSSGGNITLGGGAASNQDPTVPGGPAKGFGTTDDVAGVTLGPCHAGAVVAGASISSNGGSISINGEGSDSSASTSYVSSGLALCNGASLNSGSGKQSLRGVAKASSGYNDGVFVSPWLTSGSANLSSTNSAEDAVTLYAEGPRDGFVSFGLVYQNSNGGGMILKADSLMTNVSKLDFRSGGALIIQPTGTSFRKEVSVSADFNLSTSTSRFEVGSTTNSQTISVPSSAPKTIAGDFVIRTSSFSLSSSLTSTGSNGQILVVSDDVTLGANLATTSSNGVVTLAPRTNNRVIDLGTEVSGRLSLTGTELNRVSAGTLRIGAVNGSNSGNINVTAAIAPTGVSTLALRTTGVVQSSGSGSITEVNLAIQASVIDLQGSNSITGNLALNAATGLTYNQLTGSFTPSTVDQITPEYGVATQITMSQVPAGSPIDQMMAVAFNPPPVATLTDMFNNELTTANTLSSSYTVTASKASGAGTLTGTTSTSTSTRGVARFTNLSISDSSGVHRIAFTATVTATSAQISGTPTATTGDYNIKVSQTLSFTSTAPASARASGATYTPQATASSGLTVAITVDASASSVCSISAGVVSFVSQGTCVLNANQFGNSTFSAAQQVQQSFAVASAQLETPSAPTVAATANTLKSLNVSWTAVTDAVSYTVKVYEAPGTGSASAIIVGITGTSTTIRTNEFSQIADGTQYYISVTAIASVSDRNSAESAKTTATTNSPAVSPTISFQPTGLNRTVGQSATFSVGATKSDNGTLSYQWRKDGTNISGATSSTLTRNPLTEADSGSYSVVITNTLNGTTASTTSNAVSLTVSPTLAITTPTTGLSAQVNSPYSLTISATGGRPSLTFSTSSTLPTGVSLSSGGVLSGTPLQSGTFPIVVTVTDLNSATALTSSFNLVVAPAPGLVPTFATPISSISGQTERLTVQITNYDSSYSYSGTASIGTVSISNTGLVTISGVSSGQTTSATITTSRTHYQTASATVSATMTPIPLISYNSSDLNSFRTDTSVRDLSGRGNHATRSATVTNSFDIDHSSGAWKFPGGTNAAGPFIDLPDLSTNTFSSGITIDFEADFGSVKDDWERIIDFGVALGSTQHNLLIARAGNTDNLVAEVYRSGSSTFCSATGGLTTPGMNRWTITLTSNSCVIMRNGTELVRTTQNMSLTSGITWQSTFIGRSNWTADRQFEGRIRSVRIYSGALNFSQIGEVEYKTLTYNSDGGTSVPATTRTLTSGETELASSVTRTGYSFLGWYNSTNTVTRTKIGDAAARFTPSSNTQLFAGWDANTLNVTFNSNSGSLVTSTTTRTGESLAAPANPTRVGYTFAGWFPDSGLSGSAITFPYSHGQTTNFTLWAKWTPNSFTVSFVTNGGSAVTAFTARTAEPLPNSFTTSRAGYTFAGWFTDSGLSGSAVSFPYTHGQIEAFTLYAKWNPNNLTVTYNSNGGSAVTAGTTRTGENVLAAPANPTRDGYTFAGWFANPDLTGSQVTFPHSHGQTANFTLHAKWDANTLNVIFQSNGGSSVTATTTRTGEPIVATVTTTRAGYTFAGWFDNHTFSGSAITFPHTHGRTSDILLYAKWTPNVNTITFDANFAGGSTRTQSITSGVSTALTANVFTRTGYTFDGWTVNDDGTGTSYSNQEVVGVTSSFTLYAKWSANTLNVTFNTNSGSAMTTATTRTGQVFSSTATTTRAGYTFAGWFDNPSFTGTEVTFPYTHGRTENFTLHAKWSPNELTVTFNTNSGSAVTAVTTRTAEVMSNTLTTTRPGYTFLGWFVNSDLTGNAISFPYTHGRTENFTLHAKWDANTLNVNFVTNSGTAVTATTTRTGESLPTSFTTTRAGYNFLGWFDNAEFSGSAISFPYTHGKTGDFTLFAKWDANTLTVSYNTNGGSALTATTTRTAESIASAPTAPTRAGYTFVNWFATSDLSGTAVSFPYAHGRTTNFTLYAKWDANTLNVTFDSNSGSAVTGTTTRTAESIASAPTAPTRAGYTFDGWYDNPGFNNSQISFPYAHGKTENFTLYAKWNANTLTVSFVPNGGSAVTALTTRTAEAISSAPVAPTRAGYDLVGWFDNAELTGSVIAFPYTHGKTESFTLYAKWEAKTLTVSFNPSGGSAVSSMTTRTAESMASAPTPPTRAGYNFLGWVENGDLSGTLVSFPYAHGKTGDFTLYAKWDANTLNVTFETKGGAAVAATTVRTDGQIAATVTTTRAGYTLVGWFDNEGLTGSAITFPYTHGKTDNFTLYAKWNANTLNVTFDTNSGTAVTATTTRTDIQLSATVTTTRAGYTFAGWFGNPELTGTQVSFPYTHGKTANFTLYAKWTPNTLNVRFEINDGTGDFVSATTTTGSEVAAPATNPSHPGFEFMGWSATEGGSALTFPYLHGRTTDFTLHAVWKAGNYTVVYQYNGATGGNSVTSQSYTTDIARTGIVLPVPTRTAYTFTGWRSDISLETPLTLKPNGRFVPVANQTVYAKWTPLDYTVTYNPGISANSGTVPVDTRLYNIGQTVSLLANSGLLGRTGYDFAGWLTSPSSSDAGLNSGQTVTVGSANINFYPKWTPKTYSISYNLNGGTGSLTGAPVSWTVGTSNVTLPSAGFTRTGYDFGGWARTAGGPAVNNSFSNNFVDESLTAIWTLKNISYTFAPGGVSSQGITRWPANASGNFGSEITLPDLNGEIVTMSGNQYLFFGWGDGSATYRSGQKFVLTETPPQFTAQWVKLLDVKYSLAGGTKSVNDAETNDGDLECVNGGLCAPNQEITLRGAPTRVGYTFAGWKTQTTSETIIREAGTKTVIRDDNYLFFAEWTPIDYIFTFNSLGGSINNSNLTGNIGRVLTLPSAGTRTGYTFSGWSPDLGVTKFAAGPTYVIGSSSAGFEATWIPDVYTIAFDWQGGIGSPQANSSYTVGRGPMTLPVQGDRVKDGFNFAGWSTTPGGEVVSNYEPTANGVLYAKWFDGNYTLDYNAQNGPTPVTQVQVQRTSSTILRTPTRANFRFIGWFDALTGGNFIGDAGDVYIPTASKTLYARWVQSSFYGVDEAALETATTYTASSGSGIDTTITHNPSGSQARIQIPAGTLPNGTVVSVRYFKDVTRQRSVIGETNNYFFSVIVSWLLGSGATATVPDTLFDSNNIQKPITVTLSNSQIKAGAMVYQIIDGVVTPLQRATVDGSITVRIYSDPELVVAATPPTAPRNVLVVGPGRGSSTVSWLAPQSNGGSALTNYNVYLDGVLACSAITVLSCELTNLSDSNTYNVRVIANNAVGGGEAATTSFTTQAPPSSSSGGGSTPGPVLPVKPVDPAPPLVPVKPAPVQPITPAPVLPVDPAAPAPVAPVEPVAPAEPKPETNASGEQTSLFDLSWLLWLLALVGGTGGGFFLLARFLKRRPKPDEGFSYPSQIAESSQFKDS